MRVLMVHKSASLIGGAEVFVRETQRVLRSGGHDAELFASRWGSGSDLSGDLLASEFPDAPEYGADKPMFQRAKAVPSSVYSLEARRAIRSAIQKFKPDVAHVFAFNTQLSLSILHELKRNRIPVVLTCNDYKHICPAFKLFRDGEICLDCRNGRFYQAAANRCSHASLAMSSVAAIEAYAARFIGSYRKHVDHFTFSSDYMAQTTQDFWQTEISWNKLLNPMPVEFSAGREIKLPKVDPLQILYFGRLVEEKGVEMLVDACLSFPGVRLRIVGSGPRMGPVLARIGDAQSSNVEVLGPIWGTALHPIIDSSSLVAIPSIWPENFPYVALQSFAHGRPILATAVGGLPEVVGPTEERGWLAPPTVDGLRSALQRVLGSTHELSLRGEAGQRYLGTEMTDKATMQALNDAYGGARAVHEARHAVSRRMQA